MTSDLAPDLPLAPAKGQTALRVIERSEAFVLCEDKSNFGFRYLFTRDGKCVSTGGATLSLTARVMKPAPEDRPPEPEPPPQSVIASAAKQSTPTAAPAQMSLF